MIIYLIDEYEDFDVSLMINILFYLLGAKLYIFQNVSSFN